MKTILNVFFVSRFAAPSWRTGIPRAFTCFFLGMCFAYSPRAYALPDLIVREIAAPVNVAVGEEITVTNVLANIGPDNAGTWRYQTYLSADSSITLADTILRTSGLRGAFNANSTNTYNYTITIPGGVVPGTYYIGVIIDYDDRVVESDESNNTLAFGPVTVAPGPDLIVRGIEAPSMAGTLQTITITNTLANIGPSAAGSSRYRVYLSTDAVITAGDTAIKTSSYTPSFAANSTNVYVDQVEIPEGASLGLNYIGVIADYDDRVIEANENNNTRAFGPVNIVIGADIVAQQLIGPTVVGQSQNVSITNVLANIGIGDADTWRFRIYLSTDAVITDTDTVLKTSGWYPDFTPGTSNVYVNTVTIPGAIAPGTYYFGVIADYDDRVAESSEVNNALAFGPISVVSGADLTVREIHGPTDVGTLQVVTITNVLANIGLSSAGSWRYRVYFSDDADITVADTVLRTSSSIPDFPEGTTNVYVDTITIPEGATPGNHYLGVIADYDSQVSEPDENNNSLAFGPISVIYGPDIEAQQIFAPASSGLSQNMVITNILTNLGIADADDWRYRIYLSVDPLITTTDVVLRTSGLFGSFAVGVTNTYVDSVTIPGGISPGVYFVGLIADYDDRVGESVETNNTITGGPVTLVSGADLTVRQIEGPTSVGTLQTISITNTLANVGVTDAGSWRYRVYLSDDADITMADTVVRTSSLIPDFPAGSTNVYINSIIIPEATTPGLHYLGVIMDYDGQVLEADESNNILAFGPISVVYGADIEAQALYAPTSARLAEDVVITNILANIGVGDADDWRYRIYLSADPVITVTDTVLRTSGLYGGFSAGATNDYVDSVTIPGGIVPGDYHVGVIADFDNRVLESSEANNTISFGPIAILAPTTPRIRRIEYHTNEVFLSISDLTPLVVYYVEYTPDLYAPGPWTTATVFTAQGSITNWTDSVPPPVRKRYYRISSN